MEEQRINNAAIGGAIGFFSVFCDFHEKYLKKGVKISLEDARKIMLSLHLTEFTQTAANL